MVKSMHRNSLNETSMTTILLTQLALALTGSPCFDFSFELSLVSSLSDWGISFQIFGAKEERLSIP